MFIYWWPNSNTWILASNEQTSNSKSLLLFRFTKLFIKQTRKSFFRTLNRLESVHLLLNNRTQTPYFWLQTIEHRTVNIFWHITSLLLKTLFLRFPLTQNPLKYLFLVAITMIFLIPSWRQANSLFWVPGQLRRNRNQMSESRWMTKFSLFKYNTKDCETIKTNSFYDILQIFYNYLLL